MSHIRLSCICYHTNNITHPGVGEVVMFAYIEWLKEQSSLYSIKFSSARTIGPMDPDDDDHHAEGEPKADEAEGDEEDDEDAWREDMEGLPEERIPKTGYRTQKV